MRNRWNRHPREFHHECDRPADEEVAAATARRLRGHSQRSVMRIMILDAPEFFAVGDQLTVGTKQWRILEVNPEWIDVTSE